MNDPVRCNAETTLEAQIIRTPYVCDHCKAPCTGLAGIPREHKIDL